MKPAEEWLSSVGDCLEQDLFCGNPQVPGSKTENIIKQIQFDAWRQGMLDAIEQLPPTEYGKVIKDTIIAVMDRKANSK